MRAPPTVILPDYIGRLGNRLYVFIHTLAACMHWDFRCINLTMQPHAALFENLRRNSFCRFPAPRFGLPWQRLTRAVRLPVEWAATNRESLPGFCQSRFLVVNFQHLTEERMDHEDFAAKVRGYPWTILWGWASRAHALLANYQGPVSNFLRINRRLNPALSAALDHSSAEGRTRICMHIRLGDRRSYAGQTFPVEFYARQSQRLMTAHPQKKLEFWICSDEPIDLGLFPPGTRISPHRSLQEDFQIMVEAHYLLGGISTLSRAACYLGKSRIFACSSTEDVPLDFAGWHDGPWALSA